MRLLIDAHVFDGKFQGTRTYLQGLYTHLTHKTDIEFFFAAHDTDNLRRTFGTRPNVHYVPLSGGSIRRLATGFDALIRRHGIDYAHFQYISPLRKRCKEIVTIHDLLFLDYPQYFSLGYRLKNNFFFRRSARRADILLTVSGFSRQEITRHYGIPPEAVHVVPNGILPTEQGMPLPDAGSRYGLGRYLLSVSRIEPRKNYLTLLKAYHELGLCEQGYRLVIVGSPDLKYEEFSRYLASLPRRTRESVLIFPATYPELVWLYRHASLFVFPSCAEGFGIPPLEAVAEGCPTLCSNATAMADFTFMGDDLFSPHDLGELKRKIRKHLAQPDPEAVARQREEALRRYDWARIAETFYTILSQHQTNRNL